MVTTRGVAIAPRSENPTCNSGLRLVFCNVLTEQYNRSYQKVQKCIPRTKKGLIYLPTFSVDLGATSMCQEESKRLGSVGFNPNIPLSS